MNQIAINIETVTESFGKVLARVFIENPGRKNERYVIAQVSQKRPYSQDLHQILISRISERDKGIIKQDAQNAFEEIKKNS
jgi:hypothetical protein